MILAFFPCQLRTVFLLSISFCLGFAPTSVHAEEAKVVLKAPSARTGLPKQQKIYSQQGSRKVLSRVLSDFNGDGRIDFEEVLSKDGQWTQEEKSDLNGDGLWDVISLYNWSPLMKRAVLTEERFDTNQDGRIDLWKTYTRSEALNKRLLDRNLDGRPDYWEHYSNNLVIRVESDEDGDGSPDRIPVPRINSR